MKIERYLKFREENFKGKTKRFDVVPVKNQDDILAIIKWHIGWRQYVLECNSEDSNYATIWDSGCLKQIQEFIDKLNNSHKTE